jgi:hypothetical protein
MGFQTALLQQLEAEEHAGKASNSSDQVRCTRVKV